MDELFENLREPKKPNALKIFERVSGLSDKNSDANRKMFSRKDYKAAKNMVFDSEGKRMSKVVYKTIEQDRQLTRSHHNMTDSQWTKFKAEYLKYLELFEIEIEKYNEEHNLSGDSELTVTLKKIVKSVYKGNLLNRVLGNINGEYYIQIMSKADLKKFE